MLTMGLIVLLFILFLVGLIFLYNVPGRVWSYYNLCKAMRSVPSYGNVHWLYGHTHIIEMTHEFAEELYTWRNENKFNIDHLWVGPFKPIVFVRHPEYIKGLLKSPKADDVYSMLQPWLGRGLLIENGQRWFKNRRLLTPAFHFDILKPYVHVYNDCTDILLRKWEKCAIEGTTVEVYNTINQLTLDVILRCACSYFSNCQEKRDGQDTVDPYVRAVLDLCDISTYRYLNPVLAASNFLFMYCTPQGWRYRRALKAAHQHSERIIKERKASLKSEVHGQNGVTLSKRKCLDFLDVLLQVNQDMEDGLSDLEIRNEVDTFVFEGYDTTANALTWTLYFLAKYPEHQEKCREEVKDVLRGRNHLDYDDLSKLQYTQCCIKEAMRLCPPVFHIYRDLTDDVWIGGKYIPKDAMLLIDIFGIHTNPEVWENPTEYNPLRFHPDNDAKDRDPFSFIPFSAGPRNCIGQNFAFNEEQVVIASILNKFSLDIVDDRVKELLKVLPVVLLRPVEELHLKLTPID